MPAVLMTFITMLSTIKTILSRLLLVFLSVAITLLLIEVFMRVGFDLLPPQIQGEIQAVRVVPWRDKQIIPPVPFEADRGYQALIAPGYEDYPVRWMDAQFTFDTISLWEHPVGLRTSDSPRWPIGIMAFGDSFTFCWTDVEDCWVQQLESEHGWSTINAGQPGTGPSGQARLIEEVGIPIEPRLVVWQRYPNDSFDDYVLYWFREEAPGLSSAPAADPVPALEGLEQYSALLTVINRRLNPPPKTNDYLHSQVINARDRSLLITTDEYTHPSHSSYPATAYGWERNLEAYTRGVELLEAIDTQVIFLLVPTKEEAYADYLGDYLSEAYLEELSESRTLMLEACEANEWHCVDALPAFQDAILLGTDVYYGHDFHLDESGNDIITQLVNDYIVANQLLE